jgi:hypothetical protein
MNWKRMPFPFLFLAVLAAGSVQGQTSDLVDVTGTFANNAPLTQYSSPGGAFSADITVPSSLSYNSSDTFNFIGNVSAFRYSLNGGAPVVVDSPFAYVSSAFGSTSLHIQDGFRLTTATLTPFFFGSFNNNGSLIPGTYALTGASAVTPNTGDTAPITSGTLTIQPVPEPSTLVLAGSGAALVAAGTTLRRCRPTPRGA